MAGVSIVGLEKVLTALRLVEHSSKAGSRRALSGVLHMVERQARVMLSLGWHPPGTPTGSVPPAPPWRISGALSRSVGVGEPRLSFGRDGLTWRGTVGASIVYARIHELGGWTGAGHRTYLPPRPYLKPAWRIVGPVARGYYAHEAARFTRPPRI